MPPRIFIGGTGRSGTSILYKVLGCHEVIYALPTEMRFLIDPDGLINLVDALTIRYSTVQAREALFKFERLMRIYLCAPQKAPYPGFNFPDWLGSEYYWQRLNQYCLELVDLKFSGTDWQVERYDREERLIFWVRRLLEFKRWVQQRPFQLTKLMLPRTSLKVVKYFHDRSRLIELSAVFVDDLFLHAAHEKGKQTWCEKTPHNLLHIDFLWELFPESVFIHIKRDPRGVVHSLTKQSWAPSEVREASMFLRRIYDRWFDLKNKIDLNKYCYLELKLEDMAASPRFVLEEVVSFCGLENRFKDLPNITLDKVSYWQKKMTSEEKQQVNKILGSYIERMGYEV